MLRRKYDLLRQLEQGKRRASLRFVAAVAGLILTTDGMVAELRKEEKAPAPPPGAGMDY